LTRNKSFGAGGLASPRRACFRGGCPILRGFLLRAPVSALVAYRLVQIFAVFAVVGFKPRRFGKVFDGFVEILFEVVRAAAVVAVPRVVRG